MNCLSLAALSRLSVIDQNAVLDAEEFDAGLLAVQGRWSEMARRLNRIDKLRAQLSAKVPRAMPARAK